MTKNQTVRQLVFWLSQLGDNDVYQSWHPFEVCMVEKQGVVCHWNEGMGLDLLFSSFIGINSRYFFLSKCFSSTGCKVRNWGSPKIMVKCFKWIFVGQCVWKKMEIYGLNCKTKNYNKWTCLSKNKRDWNYWCKKGLVETLMVGWDIDYHSYNPPLSGLHIKEEFP